MTRRKVSKGIDYPNSEALYIKLDNGLNLHHQNTTLFLEDVKKNQQFISASLNKDDNSLEVCFNVEVMKALLEKNF